MAEEPQGLSIQQRIAALKQAQAGHTENDSEPPLQGAQPSPQSVPVRNKTVNSLPFDGGSPVKNASDGYQRPPSLEKPKPKVPPALPSRKPSEQAPALPRRPSVEPHRRNSRESTASDTSLSTTTSAGKTTGASSASTNGSVYPVRAPGYGETDLPPLPPRRDQNQNKGVTPPLPSRPRPTSTKSTDDVQPPVLPARRDTSNNRGSRPVPLPPRTPSRGNIGQDERSSSESSRRSGRKLPPPPPSAAAVDKIRQSGLAGLNKGDDRPDTDYGARPNGVSQEHNASPVPPPVPLSSRPDLSKIQATKPRMPVSNGSTGAPSTICLKCRDFRAPDSHAARFPRQSLPSHDLGWLANELTGPFPSPTDKARVLFTWLHHNIEYDVKSFFNNSVKPSTPASTLATGLAVCEGYAHLFAALARHAGLEAVVISGHGKGFGHQELAPGSSVLPYKGNHAWNAVKIDNGQWKLIDATWGAGAVQGAGQPYLKRFEPAMFVNSNDELGLKHYPGNRDQFYRDDGRAWISWEEYMLGNPNSPLGAEQPVVFDDARKHSIGEGTFLPAAKCISIRQPGAVRFQFKLICEHWTLEQHSGTRPGLFLLMVHGVDGRNEERIPMNHVRGSGPGGGGDFWYVDVADARTLGAPGQKAQLAVLTSFGDHKDARGVSVQEYREKIGRVGMAWAYIADWQLVS